jgi:uncharacterized protein YozE (UPF0346 family)
MIFSFRDWLIRTKLHSKTPTGDLTRDIFFDETSPGVANPFAAWREHLKRSPENVLEVFDEAWRAYRKSVKRTEANRVQGFATPEAATAPIERR